MAEKAFRLEEGEEHSLGTRVVQPISNPTQGILERIHFVRTAGSHHPFEVDLVATEFTSVCPVTGQPDFGQVTIRYRPVDWLVESKSLKLYLGAYRQEPIFHEAVVVKICDDLFDVLMPAWIRVFGKFNSRGGIAINPSATRSREDF